MKEMIYRIYIKTKYGECGKFSFKKISKLIEKNFYDYYKKKEKHSIILKIAEGFGRISNVDNSNIDNIQYDFETKNSLLLFSKSYFHFKYPYKKISKEIYYFIKYYHKNGGEKNPPEDIHWGEWVRILSMIESAFYNIWKNKDNSEIRRFEISHGLKEFITYYFHIYK